jgi:hypothetical protein
MIEDAIRAAVTAALEPLNTKVDRLLTEVAALRAVQPPALVSVERAAELAGTCAATMRAWCTSGRVPCRRVGRKWMVDVTALRPLDSAAVGELARKARR